jgi:hypothetical protein
MQNKMEETLERMEKSSIPLEAFKNSPGGRRDFGRPRK